MATLKNHPGFWLRDDAAAAFDRMEDNRGVIGINDAGRTVAEQNGLIARWNRGGSSNRPPYLYQPATPAEASNHVRNQGAAFDTSDWRQVKEYAHLYGFKWLGPGDPVHFDWVGGGTAPDGPATGGALTTKNEIRIFQEKLLLMKHDLGPSGADGINGSKTQAATLHEQKMAPRNGFRQLAMTGIPDWSTNAYLDWWLTGPGKPQAASPKPQPAKPAPQPAMTGRLKNGDEMKIFQQKLLRMHHDLGPSGADGIYGDHTALATMHEQKMAPRNGYPIKLDVDGIPGWATNAYLDWWITGPGKNHLKKI